jgi:hypothetical protein
MAMVVRPCVTDGERIFEEAEEVDWQERMRESTWAHQERMDMVAEARIVEMDEAAREGQVYVVSCSTRPVTSAHQARQVGKYIMMWLGKECAIERLLPGGMVTSKERTEEHVLAVLQHGELNIVAKRTTAQ